jgi:hypothetical protein
MLMLIPLIDHHHHHQQHRPCHHHHCGRPPRRLPMRTILSSAVGGTEIHWG